MLVGLPLFMLFGLACKLQAGKTILKEYSWSGGIVAAEKAGQALENSLLWLVVTFITEHLHVLLVI